MKIIIFGFTGSGKSSRLNNFKSNLDFKEFQFVDLDEYTLERFSEYSSLSELIESKGWKAFREIERESIELILSSKKVVLALGGGSVDKSLIDYLASLDEIYGIYVKEEFITCWNRIKNDRNRLITLGGMRGCEVLYNERADLFSKLENVCLDI